MLPLLFALAMQSGGGVGGVVSGRVVDADSGEAIGKASVSLVGEGASEVGLTFGAPGERLGVAVARAVARGLTGADGRFVLEAAPKSYRVVAERAGYVADPQPVRVTVAGGTRWPELTLKLRRQVEITGGVRDENGDPLAGVRVEALTPAGPWRWGPMEQAFAMTNDAGEYRMAGLVPGRYVVCARMAEGGPTYAAAYFPGARDPEAAELLALAPGEVRAGVDFRMVRRATVGLRGRVGPLPPVAVDPAAGLRQAGLMVLLEAREGTTAALLRSAEVNDAGEFTFSEVPAGSYVVTASYWGEKGRLIARQRVELKDRDLSVALALEAPMTLRGRVEGAPSLGNLLVFLRPTRLSGNPPGNARSDAQGRFVIAAIDPDEYRPRVTDLPAGFYVKSLRFAEAEVTGQLDLLGGVGGELVIVLDNGVARISGRVVDAQQRPVAQAVVVLLGGPGEIHQGQANARGEYTFDDLAPGEYRLSATRNPGFLSPEMMEQVTGQGVKLKLAAGEREVRVLTVR